MAERVPAYLQTHTLRAKSLVVDLAAQVADLRSLPVDREHRGVTLVKDGMLNVVMTVLREGGRLEEHEAPGPISIQVLDGSVRVRVDGEDYEVTAGQMIALEAHVRHEVIAVQKAALLTTIAWEAQKAAVAGQVHTHTPEELERALARLEREVRRIDPTVETRISSYRWHDDDVFDVDLVKGNAEMHLEVTCDRVLERSTLEPVALEHDLEEAIHDLNRRAGRG